MARDRILFKPWFTLEIDRLVVIIKSGEKWHGRVNVTKKGDLYHLMVCEGKKEEAHHRFQEEARHKKERRRW